MAEDDVEVRFGANDQGVSEAVGRVQSSAQLLGLSMTQLREVLQGMTRPLYAVRQNLGELAEAFAAIEVYRKLSEWTEAMTSLGEQTERTAIIFGITTEQAGFLNYAAQQTGGSAEGLTRSLEQLALRLEMSAGRATPTTKALEALGLSAKDLINVPLPQMLEKLRDAFEKLGPGMQRVAVTNALVRGGAENLLPVLALSHDRWQVMKKDFDDTGASMSGQLARAFSETHERIDTAHTALIGLSISLFNLVRPAIDALVEGFTNFVEGLTSAIKNNIILHDVMQTLAFVIDIVVAGVLTLGEAFVIVFETAIGLIGAVKDGFKGIAYGLDDLAHGSFRQAGNDFSQIFVSIGDVAEKTAGRIAASVQQYKDIMAQLFGASHAPTAVTVPGQGGGGALDFSNTGQKFQSIIDGANKSVTALKAQADAFGLSSLRAAYLTEQQKLLADAEAKGITVDDTMRARIDVVSAAYAEQAIRVQHLKDVQTALEDVANGIAQAFAQWDGTLKGLGDSFLKLAAQMAEAVIQALIFDAIMSALGFPGAGAAKGGFFGLFSGLFGGGKADGGPLEQGKWYIAGEHGPEPIWGGGAGAFAAGYGGQQQQAVTINYAPQVQAMNASGVAQVLKDHGLAFAREIGKRWSLNPSTRPSY